MKELIEALNIFLKYGDESFPTHCEHDYLYVCGQMYHRDKISQEDLVRLKELHFEWDEEQEFFISGWFGSC